MRSIIRKVIREMASTNLRNALIAMGRKQAQKNLGISLEDYVTIIYDNDLIEYVSDYIPELLNLTKHSGNSYDYNGDGPLLRGLVFKYVRKHKTTRGNVVLPYALIPQSKLEYLVEISKLLTEEMIVEFINEYYHKDITRIIPIPTTNFG